jgi:hypothetical protein
MNRHVLSAIALSVMLTTGAAYAQTTTLRTRVPFDFVIGNQHFPAGTYEFERLLGTPTASDAIGMVAVRRVDAYGYKVIITRLEPTKAQSESKLIDFSGCRWSTLLVATLRSGRPFGTAVRLVASHGA